MNRYESELLSLLTHTYIFYQIKTPFQRSSVLLTGNHSTLVVTLFFSLTHVTCIALHHSGHQVLHQVLHQVSHQVLCQWSPGDLPQVLRIWESDFYYQVFFTLHSFLLFQGFPGASSSNSKLARLFADLQNIAPIRLFFEVIFKIYIYI